MTCITFNLNHFKFCDRGNLEVIWFRKDYQPMIWVTSGQEYDFQVENVSAQRGIHLVKCRLIFIFLIYTNFFIQWWPINILQSQCGLTITTTST